MATLADTPVLQQPPHRVVGNDSRFFMVSAIVMTLVVVAGFSTQLAMGRSSFAAPPLVHAHAIVFMGWVVLYLLQNVFVATGNTVLHRRLGWIGTGWVVAMVVLGCMVTVSMVRSGQVPFFFQPVHFLVLDPMTVFTFAGLTAAAVVLRRQTGWHRRLHFCGMALLIGPGFGRLLPMPLLPPWAFEATFIPIMLFPLVGVIADRRRSGRVHPAWAWGIAVMLGSLAVTNAIAYGPLGPPLYNAITAGSPGAAVPPYAFPPPPSGPQVTGRT
ncbi:hypothetical protein GCM10011529_14200 [Polymorphobacter glacialis]|uniref:Uncharacterized protein n=1 Tax=Sandarakinorhabdus glacialis TaxID=1614636 RepID=A0A916ZQ85_9SPHN|nr:hypothetical protein [Polymorphobacter glacialis]GGE08937.1 hypothetical protein GCM10011529_14200 [Polymorphobacter glacialis]